MKKRTFDFIVIFSFTAFLAILIILDLLEQSAKFGLIPLLVAYYIGQYSERKFKNSSEASDK